MASPQRENGYTAIANEILEHLICPGINGSEYRILLLVVRKTYGFQKIKDRISLSQFQKGTLMNRKQAARTINSLVSKRILLKENGVYKLNKNWEEWVVSKRTPSVQIDTGGVQIDTTASVQKDTKSSVQKDTHKRKKENITKETNIQKKALTPSEESFDFFEGGESYRVVKSLLIEKIPEAVVDRELSKFRSYWTEPNKSGTKVRWQLQQTFDVKRRIRTWLERSINDYKPKKGKGLI